MIKFILNAVQSFKICFRCTPVQSVVPRIRSKLNNQKQNCIATKKGGNMTSPFQPRWFFTTDCFLFQKKGGGQRQVLDLSALNQFIETEHFKMENLDTLKSLLNNGGLYNKFRPETST